MQSFVVSFSFQAMKRPSIGRTAQWPFVLHVNSLATQGPPTPGLEGTVEVRPQLPLWLALLLLVLLAAFCGLLAWVGSSLPGLSQLLG